MKPTKLLCIALVTIMALTVIASTGVVTAQATMWSAPQKVDDVGYSGSLALDPAGTPHIIYWSGLGYKYASQNADGIITWTTESSALPYPLDPSSSPSLAINAAGTPYVSYGMVIGSEVWVGVAEKADTGTWIWRGGIPDTEPTLDSLPSIAFDAAGTAHVVSRMNGQVAHLLIPAVGTPTRESIGYYGSFPSLAVDATGAPHIAYLSYLSQFALQYASPPTTSGAWTTEEVVSDGLFDAYPSVAFDAAGTPHVSYFTEGELRYASRNGDGTAWSTATEGVDQVGVSSGDSSKLAFDPAGTAHIVYYKEGQLVYASRTGDGMWYKEDVASVGYYTSTTTLAFDAAGTAHISYTSKDGALMYIKREVTPQSAAQEVRDFSASLSADSFNTPQNYNAYVNKLSALADAIAAGDYTGAQAKISNDLLKRQDQWGADPGAFGSMDTIVNDLAILQAVQGS